MCVRDVFMRKSHKLSITLVNFVEASSHGHNFAWILLRHVTGLEGSFSKIFTGFKKVSRLKKFYHSSNKTKKFTFASWCSSSVVFLYFFLWLVFKFCVFERRTSFYLKEKGPGCFTETSTLTRN